jgi:predicted aspartyl protease
MALYSYLYDETYDPAMPVVKVQLVNIDTKASLEPISALVDSGADGTLVPVELLEEIGAMSVGSARLRWLWKEGRRVKTYLVRLEIGSLILRGIRVASVPTGTEFILGRNVVNQMEVTLNGPASTTEIKVP